MKSTVTTSYTEADKTDFDSHPSTDIVIIVKRAQNCHKYINQTGHNNTNFYLFIQGCIFRL